MNILAEYRYDGIYHLEFDFKGKKAIALMLEDESKRNGKTVFKTEYFGAFPKVITLGMSCGGMMSILIAAKSPESIEGLYIDAPVVSFLSCPARLGNAPDVHDGMWQEFERAWGMTKSDILTFNGHPFNKIDNLVQNKIKIYMAYGDSDKTVPYEENGIAIERAYKSAGLEKLLYIDKKVGVDHHPHGPTNIDFAIKYFEN